MGRIWPEVRRRGLARRARPQGQDGGGSDRAVPQELPPDHPDRNNPQPKLWHSDVHMEHCLRVAQEDMS